MSVTLKPYPDYKDTRVPWIGKVPEHWEVRRLKFASHLIMGQSPPSDECNFDRVGLPFLQGCAEFGERYPRPRQYCPTPRKTCPPGAILLSVRAPVGSTNIANRGYGIGRGLCAIVPDERIFRLDFASFVVRVSAKGLMTVATGSTYDAVSVGDVGGQPIALPAVREQSEIARFLDVADRHINRLIRAKRRIIDLLNEQKQAIIHSAVTRGLDPNVRLKPSGIAWLGDVPEHWGVQKLKHVAQLLVSNVDKHTVEGEIAVRLCNYTDVYKNEFIDSELEFMSASATPDEIEKFRIRIGDVIITKDSETWDDIGVPSFVTFEAPDLVCGYHLAILRPRAGRIRGEFLHRSLQDGIIASQLYVAANGVTRYGLSQQSIKDMLLPIPPAPEQLAIVETLAARLHSVSAAIGRVRREVDFLREYRTRLIADVVTGKLDVRSVELPTLTEDESLEDVDTVEETQAEEAGEAEEVSNGDA